MTKKAQARQAGILEMDYIVYVKQVKKLAAEVPDFATK